MAHAIIKSVKFSRYLFNAKSSRVFSEKNCLFVPSLLSIRSNLKLALPHIELIASLWHSVDQEIPPLIPFVGKLQCRFWQLPRLRFSDVKSGCNDT